MNTSRISRILSSVLIVGLCSATLTASAQQTTTVAAIPANTVVIPAASFGGVDLSMLTNHASLVKYCFKQVQRVDVNVTCGSQADSGSNLRSFPYTNSVKSLDDIMTSLLANQVWWLHVTSPTDYFNLSVQLFDTNGYALFYGNSGSQAQQNQYGQWTLPSWAETVGIYLSSQIRIKVPGSYISGARLIARDQYGNPYPIDLPTDGDGFWFDTAYAGNGTLVLSGYIISTNGYWQWAQSAISLKDGSPVALTWVEAQVILQGSSDIANFKDARDLSTFIWSWYGQGTVPMGMATFSQGTTNVILNTYSADGQNASSYDVEDAATHNVKTYVVPAGATSTTTGTNVMKGTYYIVPQGINLTPWGTSYGVGGGKG